MRERSAAGLPPPPFQSLSKLPTFLLQKKASDPGHRWPPLPTPRSHREEHRKVLHPPRGEGFAQAGGTAALEII